MNRLVTFGCSHTEGVELDNPEKECWPAQLASALKIPLVNHGLGGASNRLIQYSVVGFEFNKDDIVIILWTYPDRYHFFNNEEVFSDYIRINIWTDNEINKFWFKNLSSDNNENFSNRTIVNQVNLFLQNKGILTYNLVVKSELNYYFDITDCNIIDLNFESNFLKKYPKANDGWHMGKKGHLELSRAIHRVIINKNIKQSI